MNTLDVAPGAQQVAPARAAVPLLALASLLCCSPLPVHDAPGASAPAPSATGATSTLPRAPIASSGPALDDDPARLAADCFPRRLGRESPSYDVRLLPESIRRQQAEEDACASGGQPSCLALASRSTPECAARILRRLCEAGPQGIGACALLGVVHLQGRPERGVELLRAACASSETLGCFGAAWLDAGAATTSMPKDWAKLDAVCGANATRCADAARALEPFEGPGAFSSVASLRLGLHAAACHAGLAASCVDALFATDEASAPSAEERARVQLLRAGLALPAAPCSSNPGACHAAALALEQRGFAAQRERMRDALGGDPEAIASEPDLALARARHAYGLACDADHGASCRRAALLEADEVELGRLASAGCRVRDAASCALELALEVRAGTKDRLALEQQCAGDAVDCATLRASDEGAAAPPDALGCTPLLTSPEQAFACQHAELAVALAEAACRAGKVPACERWALLGGDDGPLAKKACERWRAVEPCVLAATAYPARLAEDLFRACERGSRRGCVEGLPLVLGVDVSPKVYGAALAFARKACFEREDEVARVACAMLLQAEDEAVPREPIQERIDSLSGIASF